MRPGRTLFVILGIACLIAFLAWQLLPERKRSSPKATQAELIRDESLAARKPESRPGPSSVALNRGPDVVDGFRGDVHPLLHGSTRLELTAHWGPIGKGRDKLDRAVDAVVYSWFTELKPARTQQTYTERDFSAFLPEAEGEVGQLWALDVDRVATLLRQFHPHPSMHLVASGRRAGPDGAFAILRAISPSYLDIMLRIHAEFYLTPDHGGTGWRVDAWYTPAYFMGRVLVNKQRGTVDHFRLGLATDKSLNVHLTVDASPMGYKRQSHDIVRVDRMELTGGDAGLAEKISWQSALNPSQAEGRLAKVFYKFLEINWVPFDQVLAQARSRKQPIFAVVSWGATDDQSC